MGKIWRKKGPGQYVLLLQEALQTICGCNILLRLSCNCPFYPLSNWFLGEILEESANIYLMFVRIAKCICWNDSVGPLCSLPLFLHCQSWANKKSRSSTLSPDFESNEIFHCFTLLFCFLKGGKKVNLLTKQDHLSLYRISEKLKIFVNI